MKRVMFMLLSCALSPSSTGDSRSNHTAAGNKDTITIDRQAAIALIATSSIALVIVLMICQPDIFTRIYPPEVWYKTLLVLFVFTGFSGLYIHQQSSAPVSSVNKNANNIVIGDPNIRPLHHAVMVGDEAGVKSLLRKGASIDVKDSCGRTPFHHALMKKNAPIMRALLEHGADVNSGPLSSCTALSFAITDNAGDSIVKALLDHRANPNTTDTDGHTPLHHAVAQGRPSLVEALLNKGANIDAVYNDLTPLSWAVIAPAAGESIVKLLLTKGANIHIKDSNDKTPLHHAAQKGLRTIVKLLIDKGADVHAKDHIGFTYDQY